MIRIQEEDFDYASEVAAMSEGNLGVGGVVAFSGLVREMAGDTEINSMTLEHYPGMTEKALEKIEAEAQKRWPLENTLIIHRYGRLEPGDQIVLVAASSAHRDAAFDACRFLIDWLKTKAPFWKLEETDQGGEWVDAKDSDNAATERWFGKE
ncbi:MAG TPA: molybdenum cofactor biosynthesis protein MoaE [Rhodospirillales bacterium]|jgi:molybdopterin synthase catalytic subunit|nr:molybdenum cofactor biosynthesis protein MoaE [Rhodospirillales bacterium]